MAQKWNLQDIKPAGGRAPKASLVREVQAQAESPIPERRPRTDIAPRIHRPEPIEPQFDDSDLSTIDIIDGNEEKRHRVIVTSVVSVVIIICAFVVNIFLGGAEVTVHPKIKSIAVQSNFLVHTAPQTGELGYELLTLEATGERQVKASGKEQVSLRAEGKIFVYNKSTSLQRLIKNTRFESPDGLVYRIKESIEVPAATKDAKGATVPGSVVADVFADSTGEKFNIKPAKFTVPGLKGSDQFDNVYGESTVAFSGGFEGKKYILDEQELNTAQQALHVELRDKLLKRLEEEKPAGFVVYKDAVTFVYETLPSTEYGDSLATIKEQARLQVPIFKEPELANYLAEKSVPDYNNEPVTLSDPYTLTFSYTDAATGLSDIKGSTSLDITLKGNTQVVWKFDEDVLKSELVGKKKTEADLVLGKYSSSISKAQSEVRPFWANSFPKSPKNITITTILGE